MTEPHQPTFLEKLVDIIQLIIVSLAIVIPVRYFLFQPFLVRGASMEPNFYEKDYLIIDEISYRFREPLRGEVIVLRSPEQPEVFLLKRVIGLPGDQVTYQNGKIFINQNHLDESQYLKNILTEANPEGVQLKENEFYVLGDNRGLSLDSRILGPINKKYITGRVWIRGYPFHTFTIFSKHALIYN